MADVENKLNDRKKIIINTSFKAPSEYVGDSIQIIGDDPDDCFTISIDANNSYRQIICEASGKRTAQYVRNGSALCSSCLHKRCTGELAKRRKYLKLYEKYNGSEAERVSSLSEIAGDGYVAIVYGDGNNMGGIIQQFRKITHMMEFSRDVKTITAKAAFSSMGEHNITRFEVAGLGGDDIFIIVDGRKAIKFAVSLIEKYNKQFEKYKTDEYVSTLSVGIDVAKYNPPVQIILEKAEHELKRAKEIARLKKDNSGSLSFVIMDSFEMCDNSSRNNNDSIDTMLPYYTDQAKDIIRLTDTIKSKRQQTKLRNILDAFSKADSPAEAELFFEYLNAKAYPNDRLELSDHNISGYTASSGYYIKDGKKYYIWNDLLLLLDFTE